LIKMDRVGFEPTTSAMPFDEIIYRHLESNSFYTVIIDVHSHWTRNILRHCQCPIISRTSK
jgi:hypothetical protein